jgi:hypothetical protein
MMVKVEDFISKTTAVRNFAVGNLLELEHQLRQVNHHCAEQLRILAYRRSRFVELWTRDGHLLARYTPTEN